MALSEEKEKYLEGIYYNISKPGSFYGAGKLYTMIKDEGVYDISRKEIKVWLQKQEVYTTNRQVTRRFQHNHVVVGGIDDIWDTDFSTFSKENDGYKYVLICIDIFSRYAWARLCKTKFGTEKFIGHY